MGTAGIGGQGQALPPCFHRRVAMWLQLTQHDKTAGVVVLAVLEAQVTAQHQRRIPGCCPGAIGNGGWIQPSRTSRPSAGLGLY
jgi:hypothetical protein